MFVEFEHSDFAYFLTLTYSDDMLTYERNRPILNKSDVDQFVKRMKNYVDFRYFLTAEYGPKTLRPHYHMIIFFKRDSVDLPYKSFIDCPDLVLDRIIRPFWSRKTGNYLSDGCPEYLPLGDNLTIDIVTPARIHYMSKYLNKSVVPNAPTSQFSKKSPGLGKAVFKVPNRMLEYYKTEQVIKYQDSFLRVPKYFKDKLKDKPFTEDDFRRMLLDQEQDLQFRFDNWLALHPDSDFDEFFYETQVTREESFDYKLSTIIMEKSQL